MGSHQGRDSGGLGLQRLAHPVLVPVAVVRLPQPLPFKASRSPSGSGLVEKDEASINLSRGDLALKRERILSYLVIGIWAFLGRLLLGGPKHTISFANRRFRRLRLPRWLKSPMQCLGKWLALGNIGNWLAPKKRLGRTGGELVARGIRRDRHHKWLM